MNLLMIIRVAFRALVRNKMRADLTMLGIIIGVSAVIAMVSIGQGAQASVQAQIESIGTNLLFVSAGAQNLGGVRGGTGDSGTNTLTVEDLEDRKSTRLNSSHRCISYAVFCLKKKKKKNKSL